ncbi:transposase [Paenarthrobacter sp. YIM B13468]|uniref:transposase n=1 Tax=Paenarthrobacter sp. YIM B13468 TaxID=3366295 RepID=UPI00366CC3EF
MQEELRSSITDIFEKNHGPYGHRRVRELLNRGWAVARKTMLQLMRALGLPYVSWRTLDISRKNSSSSHKHDQSA